MSNKDSKNDTEEDQDRADGGTLSVAQRIAKYIEDGLRNEVGVDVHVKRIRVDMEAADDEICVEWEYPFSRTRFERKSSDRSERQERRPKPPRARNRDND